MALLVGRNSLRPGSPGRSACRYRAPGGAPVKIGRGPSMYEMEGPRRSRDGGPSGAFRLARLAVAARPPPAPGPRRVGPVSPPTRRSGVVFRGGPASVVTAVLLPIGGPVQGLDHTICGHFRCPHHYPQLPGSCPPPGPTCQQGCPQPCPDLGPGLKITRPRSMITVSCRRSRDLVLLVVGDDGVRAGACAAHRGPAANRLAAVRWVFGP
jgi:hypothetical protein